MGSAAGSESAKLQANESKTFLGQSVFIGGIVADL